MTREDVLSDVCGALVFDGVDVEIGRDAVGVEGEQISRSDVVAKDAHVADASAQDATHGQRLKTFLAPRPHGDVSNAGDVDGRRADIDASDHGGGPACARHGAIGTMEHHVELFVGVRLDVLAEGVCRGRGMRSVAEAVDDDEEVAFVPLNDAESISADGFPFGGELSGSDVHGLVDVLSDADRGSVPGHGIELEIVDEAFGTSKARAHTPLGSILTAQDEVRVGDAGALVTRNDFNAFAFAFDSSESNFAGACVLKNVSREFRDGRSDFGLIDVGKTQALGHVFAERSGADDVVFGANRDRDAIGRARLRRLMRRVREMRRMRQMRRV